MDTDALYIADRHKSEFSYPVHNHDVFELNFVENAAGVKRIVGDSNEVIGDYDLVLITNPTLEHAWEQHECKSNDIREITIQFNFGAGITEADYFFGKTPFESIRHMMKEAQKGMAFPMSSIMKVYERLSGLSQITDRFTALMEFLNILHTLSLCTGARTLATTSYAKVNIEDDSRRILRVKKYISDNYMYELRLKSLADLANMSESAFCRFFKLHTGHRLSDYIIDIRLGYATHHLLLRLRQGAQIVGHLTGQHRILTAAQVLLFGLKLQHGPQLLGTEIFLAGATTAQHVEALVAHHCVDPGGRRPLLGVVETRLLPHQQHGLLHQLHGVGFAAEVAQAVAANTRRKVLEQAGKSSLVGLLCHPYQQRFEIAIRVIHHGRGPAYGRVWLASICHCAIPLVCCRTCCGNDLYGAAALADQRVRKNQWLATSTPLSKAMAG